MRIPLAQRIPIVHRPVLVPMLFTASSILLLLATLMAEGPGRHALAAATMVQAVGLGLSSLLLLRIRRLERPISFDRPERMLIISPHQDDCVLMAGGAAARNLRLGGETHVVYLAADRRIQDVRRQEAVASWELAGLPEVNLHHLDVLPPLGTRDPASIEKARASLQQVFEALKPTVVFMPMFEGGHVQHDLANYIVSFLIKTSDGTRIYECPEYSGYLSWRNTPHRMLGMMARLLLGRFPYFGPPDGVDGRTVLVLDMNQSEMLLKKQMLKRFQSQNINAAHCYYADRYVEWQEREYRAQPWRYRFSACHLRASLERVVPPRLATRLLPLQARSYGTREGITNLDVELGRRTSE
jgi:LmbE family N-acetylglucosaminyl deacetylase